ncbi:hypothetical protein HJ01_03515 [Flavobacterium frigoris PS1]|uniref:Uncharacterized protein n=1 Tax=Flavobacterium frigoris (strain PS1) TaxID=1086011 RepID=H7FWG8_FLAFP|nr:hypothetical protein HJ01_03515 [Flavobacterium frigoris PS1]
MDNTKVRVSLVSVVQVLHKSPPVSEAPTNSKSLDVHPLEEVCATAVAKLKKHNIKNVINFVE